VLEPALCGHGENMNDFEKLNRQLEQAVVQAQVNAAVISVCVFIVTMLVLYYVVRSAVRDGMIDAHQQTRWKSAVSEHQEPKL
jgi:amino acid permease